MPDEPRTASGAVVASTPQRARLGSAARPIEIAEAVDEDLVEQGRMYDRLLAKRTSPSGAQSLGKKRGSRFPTRGQLATDVVPKLPTATTRGPKGRLQLVIGGMDTTKFPDVSVMVTEIARDNRSIPKQVEMSNAGVVLQKSNRNTNAGTIEYVEQALALWSPPPNTDPNDPCAHSPSNVWPTLLQC